MRARDLIAAGLVTAFLAACADTPENTSNETDPAFADELELALFGVTDAGGGAVVSPIELAQPEGEGQAPRVTPVEHDHPGPDAAAPVELLGVPVATLAMAGEPAVSQSALDAAMAGRVEVPERAAAGNDDDGGFDWGTLAGIGGIIIRGGVSGRDPCALHLPGRGGARGLGGVGVLINDRGPRIGPSSSSGSGRSALPRRGGIRPGGIR